MNGRRSALRLHAIVADVESGRLAVEGGATVVQFRLKGASTAQVVASALPLRQLDALFVINDDVEAALELAADGVHLGQDDTGADRVLAAGLVLGLSASTPAEAVAAQSAGAHYLGCGPVWSTATKPDAGDPIGLAGLALVCRAVRIPVIAIGGIDHGNAASCIRSGAAGVAVVRAASDARRIRGEIDALLDQTDWSSPGRQ
jgi:thiamine-phosphate pyrophosphorylase